MPTTNRWSDKYLVTLNLEVMSIGLMPSPSLETIHSHVRT